MRSPSRSSRARTGAAVIRRANGAPERPGILITPDGRIADHGAVIEIDRPRRLVLSWRHELQTPLRDEGETRVSFELEPQGEEVKLSVTHEIDHSPSPLIDALSNGWPPILSSLKSLLETGSSLVLTREWPKGL